ncbi:MAG: hypothetical protein ACP5EQ_03485 [Candidatus Cloacimonadia bacterium]
MKNKKYTPLRFNKAIYITFIIVVLFYSISFCDIGTISPTIDDHIYTDQWQDAGYPGRITSTNPDVEAVIQVNAPIGNPVKTIFKY